ncbi:3-hydroxybenzoate 6-hydroxylase [Purpureocillium lavendulum]|uniref:3-hydroxybenzoate 6-hydroxylase n=1 Tax=Purpureocillium lavendulum TaxID=1247861 RepID=A0AB34FKF5_9HYPO|nr:3-hydroxybenzoate 6-hydroxylase [Purpureocillium lavendulum]
MEDAASLGVLFPAGVDTAEVPSRLELYQRCRKARAETIQELTRKAGMDINGSESSRKLDEMTKFLKLNCVYDEHHSSIQKLRLWEHTEKSMKYWRMPLSFGPLPGPRQALGLRPWTNKQSTFVSRAIKFRTSRTLLQNLLPTPSFSFTLPGSVAYASYVHTSLDQLDWLGGKGYDYIGFFLHDVQYRKKDGSSVKGTFVAVMWENLVDPILTGREELGCPKLFCDIEVQQGPRDYHAEAGWQSAQFLKLEMHGLRDDVHPKGGNDGGLLFYKYIPATGNPGVADVEYPVHAPNSVCRSVKRSQRAQTASLSLATLSEDTLPTLSRIVERLAEFPTYEIVDATITEGTDVDNLSTAYRIE